MLITDLPPAQYETRFETQRNDPIRSAHRHCVHVHNVFGSLYGLDLRFVVETAQCVYRATDGRWYDVKGWTPSLDLRPQLTLSPQKKD